MAASKSIPLVIVAGLSGAGKSTALNVYEDLGFFSVDGLPAAMVPKLMDLYGRQSDKDTKGLAIGIDNRQHDLLKNWQGALQSLKRQKIRPFTVYLEAEREELNRRYATTRRPHPFESQNVNLGLALELERELLEPVRAAADLVLDTTHYSIHDLRRALQDKWTSLEGARQDFRVHIISFGFKYGPPNEADLLFDLRFLPNPHFVDELRPRTGKDSEVADYVLANDMGREFRGRFLEFLLFLLPLYAVEGRYRLTIGIGCTGGRHRSVAAAEFLHRQLTGDAYAVTLEHRHIDRG